jgi:uncharacterized Zn-finger protein
MQCTYCGAFLVLDAGGLWKCPLWETDNRHPRTFICERTR